MLFNENLNHKYLLPPSAYPWNSHVAFKAMFFVFKRGGKSLDHFLIAAAEIY